MRSWPRTQHCNELPADNRPDIGLPEAHDAIRDDSAVFVIKNGLLADQPADYQQLLIDMPSGDQKAAATSDQAINPRQVPLDVARLLLDGLAYLVDTGSLHLGHSMKLQPCLLAVRTRLMAKAFFDLGMGMHRINQDLNHLPRFIQQ